MKNNLDNLIGNSVVVDNVELSKSIREEHNTYLLKALSYMVVTIILFILLLLFCLDSFLKVEIKVRWCLGILISVLLGAIIFEVIFSIKHLNKFFILKEEKLQCYTSNRMVLDKKDEKAWLYGKKYFICLENDVKLKISLDEYNQLSNKTPKKVNIFFYKKSIEIGNFDLESIY